jgi:hypothetical protein
VLLACFQDISSDFRLAQLESKGITVQTYLHLMSPGVGWLFQMAAKGATKELFTDLFGEYMDHCNNSMVLRHIIQVGVRIVREGGSPTCLDARFVSILSLPVVYAKKLVLLQAWDAGIA